MRTYTRIVAMCAVALGLAAPASAQLDPLLFLKNTKPNVVIVVETANRMQRDADDAYYDQFVYTKDGALYETPLGVTSTNTALNYRRKYVNLQHLDNSLYADKFVTDTISIVGDRDPAYASFDARTRLAIARTSLIRAITLNRLAVRFGLIKTRQLNPLLGTQGNEGPVKNNNPDQQSPTDGNGTGKWAITRPTVDAANSSLTSTTPPVYLTDSATSTSDILSLLAKAPDQGGLLPAGMDSKNAVDVPIKYMLDDAKDEATRLIGADTASCRNTVVVLVVGGGEGSLSGADPAAAASSFRTVNGHRVPIYVVAIAPAASAVGQLQSIAANSGGQYFEITKAMINAVSAGSPVPEFVRAVNTAIQHTFASSTDFNAAPTLQLPYGPATEYQVTSPIIGTVNLANGHDIAGNALHNSVITTASGTVIPQRSNVMLTTGFALPGSVATPGFPGRLRAFRVYRPESDPSKSSRYKFVGDGTALWVARTPLSSEGQRNIYTVLPDGSMLPFTTANATTLQPYLNVSLSEAGALISYVRGLPLGAFVDSTPAILDAPSLDPPPDATYPAFLAANKDRRTFVFVGASDGMMHAIDARTGVEAWAVIPFNLLPKLRALREGLAVDKFEFFVDGSAKLADVKTSAGWRTLLVFGEGPGGTFYQTFDVTMPGMASIVPPDSDNVGAVLGYFADPSRAPSFKWSFPSYADFDCAISTTATPYGDMKASAPAVEKSVGQTWSDPAVGQVQDASGKYVVLAGSGFLPYSQQHQANRGDAVGGTTFYVLDADTGALNASQDVGSDGAAETVDSCAVAGDCRVMKNALQSDPVAIGPPNSRFVTIVYIGDLDGRLWRFGLGMAAGQAVINSAPSQPLFSVGAANPLFSSMAVVNVGGPRQYVFLGTGSDLLPTTAGMTDPYKLIGVLDQNGTGSQSFALSLTPTDGVDGDEKISAYPAVAGDIVFFTTTTFYPGSPCTAADTNVYALTFIGGAAYDNTGDNVVDKKDTPKVTTLAGAGRATAPFVADQHLVIAAGGKIEVFGHPEDFNNGVGQVGVRILSWREIR